jgi:hypothetical protein
MEATHRSEARVATAMAQRYMTQLCKHFEHRLPARYGASEGTIEFPSGKCRMAVPQPDLLVLHAEAATADLLGQLESVIARHLERFAFRDKPAIAWTPIASVTLGVP